MHTELSMILNADATASTFCTLGVHVYTNAPCLVYDGVKDPNCMQLPHVAEANHWKERHKIKEVCSFCPVLGSVDLKVPAQVLRPL